MLAKLNPTKIQVPFPLAVVVNNVNTDLPLITPFSGAIACCYWKSNFSSFQEDFLKTLDFLDIKPSFAEHIFYKHVAKLSVKDPKSWI